MITASKEFREKLKNGANIVNYADITLSDGELLHLTYKDFMIGGCSIEDKTTDGKFGVGFVIGKTLTIKIANYDEQFSKYDFYNSIIRVYVAMLLDDGTIEKIRKGVYYATVPSTQGEIIEINAVDGMFLLDRDYSTSKTVYPASLQMILTDACLDCGIPIGFRQFDNMSFLVQEKPEKATYRQVVSWACQIAGYNARIDNDGYMQLIWYNSALLEQYNYVGGDFRQYPHDTVIDGGNFTDYSANAIISGGDFSDMPEHIFQVKSLDVHTDDVLITGVKVIGEDDNSVLFGEEGYAIEVKNPFAVGKEQEVTNYLGGRMVGMMFRPFTAQVLNNPLYEPFEVVRVSDWKGNVYVSVINSISYKVGGYTQISCVAEDPVRNGGMYYSEAAAAVVEARRNAEKQITEYDKAVQNMNQLAANAMGFHTTYEDMPDGSRITYLHDKPDLSDSKTVYKQTIDGFFISTDGGKTYTAGFDKNGNVVVNILYAIGIVADWIRSGRFEVRKGNEVTFLADADTGEVRIVADSFSLSSGKTINSIAKEEASKKSKTFTSTPVPPYNSGDIWMNSDKSGIKVCIRSRSSGAFSASDWIKRDNYIDQAAANDAAKSAVEAQTQLDIFNRLTNNGRLQGIYLEDGNLYVNASYIKTGQLDADLIKTGFLSADRIRGGAFTVGGIDNARGVIEILGGDGRVWGKISNAGYVVQTGSYYYGLNNGILTLRYKDDAITREFMAYCSSSYNYVALHYYNKNDQTKNVDLYVQIDENEGLIWLFSKSGSVKIHSGSSGGVGVDVGITKVKSGSVEIGDGITKLGYNTLYFEDKYYSKTTISLEKFKVFGDLGQVSVGKAIIVGEGAITDRVNIFQSGITTNGGYIVTGSLTCSGEKSRIAKTKNYSDRLLYCYETTKPYFGDIGEATLDESGICYISVDDIFLETINTNCQYQVFLQKYGQGDVWVEERKQSYFLVKGTPGIKFGWELKARQLGFEMERMEKFSPKEPDEVIDYEKEAQNYIENYYKEALST